MASFNRVVLVGNLTRDAELKHLASGTSVANVSLAVNDRVKRNQQWEDETSYIDCVAFGRSGDVIAEYCRKGDSVMVEGRMKQERWQSEGQNRSKIVVVVEKVVLLGGNENRQGGGRRQNEGVPY